MGSPNGPLAHFFTFDLMHGMWRSRTNDCLNNVLGKFVSSLVTFNAYLFTYFSRLRKEDNGSRELISATSMVDPRD